MYVLQSGVSISDKCEAKMNSSKSEIGQEWVARKVGKYDRDLWDRIYE